MVQKSRLALVDVVRGLAILLVVFGHSIVSSDTNYLSNFSFNIIYSFHMPLFFTVSGYLLKVPKDRLKWIKNKAIYLLVPHIVINLIAYFIPTCALANGSNSYLSWLEKAFLYNQGEWFLWTLFCALCIMTLKGKWLVIVTALVVFYPGPDILGIQSLQWFLPFVLIGRTIAKCKITKWAVVIGAIMYIPFMWLSHWQGGWIREGFNGLTYYIVNGRITDFTLQLSQAFTGTCVIVYIAYLLRKVKVLQWLGTYTLTIYVTHILVLQWGLGTVATFVIAIGISVIVVLLLKRMKVLQRWIPVLNTRLS